jgi:hypothetical protein
VRYLQAVLYLVAATLAPVGASARDHAQATAVLYQALERRVTAATAAEVLGYLERVDPDWAPRATRHLETGRPHKVVRRLSDHKQRYVRQTGEAAWYRAHARAKRIAS